MGFHNAKSGLCFPSYERIAEAAGCARSTVAEAIRTLEDAAILSWVQRIKRVREPRPDLLGDNGWRWRVLRTRTPTPSTTLRRREPPNSSKANFQTGTPNQGSFSSLGVAFGGERTGRNGRNGRKEAFERRGDEFRSPHAVF